MRDRFSDHDIETAARRFYEEYFVPPFKAWLQLTTLERRGLVEAMRIALETLPERHRYPGD